jgi:hypothetical protein
MKPRPASLVPCDQAVAREALTQSLSFASGAFGDRLGEARAAIEALAASLPPEELNRVGFQLYERLQPDVPEGAQGRGAKGELRVGRIVGAAG